MTQMANKVPPQNAADPNGFLSFTTLDFVIPSGNLQAAVLPVQAAWRPPAFVTSAFANTTLQVTCNPTADIIAGTATWATITLASNYYVIQGSVTGIQVGSTSGTVTAYLSI